MSVFVSGLVLALIVVVTNWIQGGRLNRLRRTSLALAVLFGATHVAYSLGQTPVIEFQASPQSLSLLPSGKPLPILVSADEWAGVRRAAGDLSRDIERVTGQRPVLIDQPSSASSSCIIVGTVGHSRAIDQMVKAGKLDVTMIQGRWEATVTQLIEKPLPGVERALVIAGSDKRGSIYGVYTVSEQIGVSPWYWWADVPVKKRPELFVRAARVVEMGPAVQYRGIFLNDEAPALTGWTKEKFGGYNHEFYGHVFELILRLRGNYLWPAMWAAAFNEDDPQNPGLADEYGVVMGTSHHEPMLRAQQEWKRHGRGAWDYSTNGQQLREFWTAGVKRNRAFESIVTLGMRGDGDMPMSEESNVALLEGIVADQRRILADHVNSDLAKIPQLWALYKEVQEYYEKGMRVPDDVTLLWCDDNWGNIRRLPTEAERGRTGGAGVYYHFDYVGGPRNYKWVNTNPITKVWEQMNLAHEFGANRIWIVNVGDLKPMEFPIEYFLTLAWNPRAWPYERIPEFSRLWAEREFGPKHAVEVAALINGYSKLNGRRKPELLDPKTYSFVNYQESERVLQEFAELERIAGQVRGDLPPEYQDAFFQLVEHPIRAPAIVNRLYAAAGLNRLYAQQGRAETNRWAERARALFREDEALTRQFNEDLGHGRWRHFMDQTHLGYTYWQQPLRNVMPAVSEIQVPDTSELGVAVEGSEFAWPGQNPSQRSPKVPAIDATARQKRWLEVFARGSVPVEFTAAPSEPWLKVSKTKGSVATTERLWIEVDWQSVPADAKQAFVEVKCGGTSVQVVVPVVATAPTWGSDFRGYLESEGVVAIEAAHFARSIPAAGATASWKVLSDYGRSHSAVVPEPSDLVSTDPSQLGARLEYDVFFTSKGRATIELVCAPSLAFQPGHPLRAAVSLDDAPPQIVTISPESEKEWERAVSDSARLIRSEHVIPSPGKHVVKVWRVDPGLVLQRVLVNLGGVQPSYLGPPESPRADKSRN